MIWGRIGFWLWGGTAPASGPICAHAEDSIARYGMTLQDSISRYGITVSDSIGQYDSELDNTVSPYGMTVEDSVTDC